MARNFVVDRDHGYRELLRRASIGAQATGPVVKVGIQGADAGREHDGMTMVDIATVHEFGLGNQKERSFIRAWVDENRQELIRRLREAEIAVLFGRSTPERELARIGLWVVGGIKQRIIAHIKPELEDTTIKRKGSDTPLVDTGQMLSAITSAVVKELLH